MATARDVESDVIVLRTVTIGEADRMVTLLARDLGKISALARGALKSRQRFGAALAPFVVAAARLREKAGSDVYGLEALEVREDHTALAGDPVRFAHASYASELVRELSAPRHADPALFALLAELYAVVRAEAPAGDTLRAFELALLDALGLRPVLDRCLGCGSDEAARLDAPGGVMDPAVGGFRCAACAPAARGAGVRPLPAAARQRLLGDQAGSLVDAARRPALPAELAARARAAMHALIGAHLPGPLRSLDFLEKLRTT